MSKPPRLTTPSQFDGGVAEQTRLLIIMAIAVCGVKRNWLARTIGISEKHMSEVLGGKSGLSGPLADKMAKALGYELRVTLEPAQVGKT